MPDPDACTRCPHPWHGLDCGRRWTERVVDVPFAGFSPMPGRCRCPAQYDEAAQAG